MLPNPPHLRITTCVFLIGLLASVTPMAAIDAHCESTSALLIERIKAENLININSGGETRIKEIALDLCNETEKRVQEQHIEDKEKALENWFLNPIPKKQEIADSRQSANAAEHYAWIFYCAWL